MVQIRGELDQVMTFRDQMPSFQEILKEVSTIQTDHNWKTYFSPASGWIVPETPGVVRRQCVC
jgi:beta-hydroxylase